MRNTWKFVREGCRLVAAVAIVCLSKCSMWQLVSQRVANRCDTWHNEVTLIRARVREAPGPFAAKRLFTPNYSKEGESLVERRILCVAAKFVMARYAAKPPSVQGANEKPTIRRGRVCRGNSTEKGDSVHRAQQTLDAFLDLPSVNHKADSCRSSEHLYSILSLRSKALWSAFFVLRKNNIFLRRISEKLILRSNDFNW